MARLFHSYGVAAHVFSPPYETGQDKPDWWTDSASDRQLLEVVPRIPIWSRQPLVALGEIQQLYEKACRYDVLLLSEEGPAVFSELEGPPRVLFSNGFDLKTLAFQVKVRISPAAVKGFVGEQLRRLARGDVGGAVALAKRLALIVPHVRGIYRVQQRQRLGLRQCQAVICAPKHLDLTDALGIPRDRVYHLQFPMDAARLGQVDAQQIAQLARKYEDVEMLFLHPARQFYLRLDGDRYLKDNDKLILAFGRFCREQQRTVRLLLVRKGRAADIRNTERLIDKLGISDRVEWLPEMRNITLRAYYCLENVIVCDQFNPRSALGSIGREASFFGRPLITAFDESNRGYYGQDMPPHVFPADSVEAILEAMRQLAAMTAEQKRQLAADGKAWFYRQLSAEVLVPRLLELLRSACEGKPARRMIQ